MFQGHLARLHQFQNCQEQADQPQPVVRRRKHVPKRDAAGPGDLPLVEIDAVLIERVLVNLLENAAKYTPPGSPIQIGARVAGHHLEVDVVDAGPGFPQGREAQLFDKFERGDRESATPGVGLGLAICKAIIEAHGGRINAHNVARGGACVA